MIKKLIFFVLFSTAGGLNAQSIYYSGTKPGVARVRHENQSFVLKNNCLALRWSSERKSLRPVVFADLQSSKSIAVNGAPLFEVVLKDGTMLSSADFQLIAQPEIVSLKPDVRSAVLSGKEGGKGIAARFRNTKYGITVDWQASLKNGSNYVNQLFTIRKIDDSLPVVQISLIKLPAASAVEATGLVDGSPLTSGTFFFAVESPVSKFTTDHNWRIASIKQPGEVQQPGTYVVSTAWGVVPAGQMRRGFVYYLERERAVPYRQMLHYNSWYDLSWADRKLTEEGCLDRIKTFSDSLSVKRGVNLTAFLFDDGWDDNQSLWQISKTNFPEGFSNLQKLAGKYKASLGVWMSPWGGYEEAKKQRLEYGSKQNPPFETNSHGFSLSGPVYSQRFKSVATNFIKEYGVSMFKFDGVGAGDKSTGAPLEYQTDMESLLNLISDLRKVKPDLYSSITIGTWPSPFWLKYGDVIWRNGWDTKTTGEGGKRQQWITYRDAEAYKNVVLRAPLFPLNSLMYHGVCIADNGLPAEFEMNDQDISDEIWSFFGSGTSLQELYINPHKLNARNWDCLAAGIRWAKQNEDIMADTHWIGGDPENGDIYGFAAWSPQKGIITLRNPSSKAKSFKVNVSEIFELPGTNAVNYSFYDAKSGNPAQPKLYEGSSFSINLQPYEVIVLNALR